MTTPGGQGRFDGYDVLSQANHWDQVTQGVVLRRLGPPAPLRFFTEAEGATARVLLDRLLGQDDEPHIDVLSDIDSRLALHVTDGWHYADLPPDDEAWRATLAAIDEDAISRHGATMPTLSTQQQMSLIQEVKDAEDGDWHGLPAKQVWSLWTRYACAAFYAHPWAWNEIGFGGPAYPRGYKNIGPGRREPWEREERDPADPVPWAKRAEDAAHDHDQAMGRS